MDEQALKCTPLHEIHVLLEARMMPYAGWELPRSYGRQKPEDEVRAVRKKAGMFDVSHMGQLFVSGEGALPFMERMITQKMDMPVGTARYGFILNDDGKVIDDCISYRLQESEFLIVMNASNREKVVAWFLQHANENVTVLDRSDEFALIALQGPLAESILERTLIGGFLPEKAYTFGWNENFIMQNGADVLVSRTGYTGEDGFELLVENAYARELWLALLTAGERQGLLPCGLVARDILRQEAGMPLYGNELVGDPREDGFARYIAMDKDFIGKNALASFSPSRTRVGIMFDKREAIGHDDEIFISEDVAAKPVGHVTSTTFSPTLGHWIAMAYLDNAFAIPGTSLSAFIKKKPITLPLVTLPFYKKKLRRVRLPAPSQMLTLPTLYEMSNAGKYAFDLDQSTVPVASELPEGYLRTKPARLPELSEGEIVEFFVRADKHTYGIGEGLFPLGSCTMKYNPSVHERVASLPGFTAVHPLADTPDIAGVLRLVKHCEELLELLTGFPAITLTPAAGAQGEFASLLMFKKYLKEKGEEHRNIVVTPKAAHGTNPASAAMVGWDTREIDTRKDDGKVDREKLTEALTPQVACFMITNPNSLGIIEDLRLVVELCHAKGVLVYLDGANMNAFLGRIAPHFAWGVDAMHMNLHKTFSTPHGGGGPGAGAVGVAQFLIPFLPRPRFGVLPKKYEYFPVEEKSIGRLSSFAGNFGNVIRAYAYLLTLGREAHVVADVACANADYLKQRLVAMGFDVPYPTDTRHEFVVSLEKLQHATGVTAMDFMKRMIDYGIHPSTVYFPMIVRECLLIEPTESATTTQLDAFLAAMLAIKEEAEHEPALVMGAPWTMNVRRVSETHTAKTPLRLVENIKR